MEFAPRGGIQMKCQSCGKEITERSEFCPHCFARVAGSSSIGAAHFDEDFGILFNRATELWKDNLGDLVLFSLVFILVGWIPIVNAAFFAGYARGLLSLSRGGKLKNGDIFSAWDCFGNTLAYGIIFLAIIIAAGFIPFFGHIAQFAVLIFGTPGLYPVVDRNMNAIDAIKWSIATVQHHFIVWLIVVLVGGVLSSIGMAAFFVGVIVTLPWGTLLLIQQYERVKNEQL
jgi:hypothetical protein